MKHILFVIVLFVFSPAMAQEAEQYTCPMHPHYVADQMGACPICGMDLVPASSAGQDATGNGIVVSSEMIQTMGIRTAPVRNVTMGSSIRSYGNVMPSTRLETIVSSRVEGWIEDLAVSAEGDIVDAGDLLYRVYSPDLIAAQRDYINALKSGSGPRSAATERRLKSLGMQAGVIASLKKSRSVIERMPVSAEQAGTVSHLAIRDGEYVKPGTEIMHLQNYQEVWIVASVAEQDLVQITKDAPVTLKFPDAGETRQGTVDYIYPTVDEKTRTGKVRIVVENTEGRLKPGGYADVEFSLEQSERLAVPAEAILRDSRGTHVVIVTGEGAFKPMMVRAGITSDGYTEIEAGLSAGDMIVVSGQFLLDSEASLREGFRKMTPALGLMEMDSDTPLSQLPVNAETLALIDHFVDAGLYFHEALIDGYRIDPFFLDASLKAGDVLLVTFGETRLAPVVRSSMEAVRRAKLSPEADDHEQALEAALQDLMISLEPWLMDGAPVHYRDLGLTLFREDTTDRLWLEEGATANNPYGGSSGKPIDWPDPMAGMTDAATEQMQSGHNH